MASGLISERVSVERRYVRSADVARDLDDPAALDGYVLTSRAREALVRLSAGLGPASVQRAFRVTGPYGSGKSSFGLLLARLCRSGDVHADSIASAALDGQDFPALEPIVLVGRRTSLARELLRALEVRARTSFGSGDEQARHCKELAVGDGAGRVETEAVLDELSTLSRRLKEAGRGGLLLLIDEMGRFLEFAAFNPRSEDPSLFQRLAERASGSAHRDLAVVAFLHHRFDDYLAGSDDWSGKEWARSAERYEEITFSEPREHSVHLLANAIEACSAHSSSVRSAAHTLYSEAARRALFAMPKRDLEELGPSLYPLHPSSLACLASAASRFGQHDRSIFSFLQSSEPAGFQHFVHTHLYDAANWYRLDDVFDYLASLGGLRFDSRDRDRRWALGRETLDAFPGDDMVVRRVLKSVAVVATLEPVPGLRADADTLGWALGIEIDRCREALEALVSARVVYRRAASNDYSLWSNSSVDLGHWLAEAERAVRRSGRLDAELEGVAPLRPLIAQRHYHETGTLRSFAVRLGTGNTPVDGVDGEIVVVPVHPGEDLDRAREFASSLSRDVGAIGLVHLRRVREEDLELARELKCWKWIEASCEELRMDDLARGEVARNVAGLGQRLQERLAPLDFGAASEDWYHVGERVDITDRAELSRRLSTICRDVFSKAPTLRNELVNRAKLSSAVAAARMRLLKRMIENEREAHLGLTGAPPERTIFRSLFDATTMHRKVDGEFGFHPPTHDDDLGWRDTWERVEILIGEDEATSFDTLLKQLAKPPYGLRAGPALPLIAAVMLHHRSTIALIERGTFQPELSEAHFMRLAKNPGNFALKRLSARSKTDLLEHLSSRLSIFEGDRPAAQLKPVVEQLFVWWRGTSDFARATRHVDDVTKAVRTALRKAHEPIDLLFATLPNACSARSADGVDVDRYVLVLDHALCQIEDALPQLRRQVEVRLVDAFGAKDLGGLREQIRADYRDHLLQLGDYKLRAFIERAMNVDLDEDLWLDGVASLLVGKRLESWDDGLLDQFGFEVRRVAQELARRLAALRTATARSAPVTAIHITTSNGDDSSFYVHDGPSPDEEAMVALKAALAQMNRPEAALVALLREMISRRQEEKTE